MSDRVLSGGLSALRRLDRRRLQPAHVWARLESEMVRGSSHDDLLVMSPTTCSPDQIRPAQSPDQTPDQTRPDQAKPAQTSPDQIEAAQTRPEQTSAQEAPLRTTSKPVLRVHLGVAQWMLPVVKCRRARCRSGLAATRPVVEVQENETLIPSRCCPTSCSPLRASGEMKKWWLGSEGPQDGW